MRNRQNDVLKTVLLIMLDALAVFASASLAYIMTIGFDNYEITIELIVWCVCNVLLTI